MVFENQARFTGSGEALKEKRRGDAADAATHDDAVVDFSGIDGRRTVGRVAHLVPRGEHFERVAVGGGVVADTAIAGPFVIGGEQLSGSQAVEKKGAEASRAEPRKSRRVMAASIPKAWSKFWIRQVCSRDLLRLQNLWARVQRTLALLVKLILNFQAGVVGFYRAQAFHDGVNPALHVPLAEFFAGHGAIA